MANNLPPGTTLSTYSAAAEPQRGIPAKSLSQFACVREPVAHTGDTDATELCTLRIPGGTLGETGALRATLLFTCTNSANDKTVKATLGETEVYSDTKTAVDAFQVTLIIRNRTEESQVAFSEGGAVVLGTEDTKVDRDLVVTGTLEVDSETITLADVILEVIK